MKILLWAETPPFQHYFIYSFCNRFYSCFCLFGRNDNSISGTNDSQQCRLVYDNDAGMGDRSCASCGNCTFGKLHDLP